MPNGDIHVPIVFCGLNCPVAGVLPLIIRSATPPGMATSRPQDCVSLRLGGRSRVSFSVSKEAQDKDFVIEFGKAKVMMPGTNVTVVAFSRTVGEALMPLLRGNGRRVSNLGSIRPFDRQAIIDSVKTTNHIVSIEKGWGQSGIDVEIVGIIIEMEAFDYLDISLERVTYRYRTLRTWARCTSRRLRTSLLPQSTPWRPTCKPSPSLYRSSRPWTKSSSPL
ncbi:hypothetical protein L917_17202 [Phytophthora nicotianae]|uniref:Pyruvate dehydrogenase E1 component subunit beta n=1 Tax=Phytophthora nicotianae TaxID=4792 RepID=W2KC64_PHYNI|nr:hypothetical protein L917_17202 [Phytophthora nicotianae]